MLRNFHAWHLLVPCALALSAWAFAADNPEQRVDRIFSAYQGTGSPGCALGVIRDGNFIYKKGYGAASLELGVPLTPESVFDMGSVSKQFTAASVVLASQKGLLSLDDDVHKYIPELPDYGTPITLRQMLNHTSGLRDIFPLWLLAGHAITDVVPTAELLDLVVHQKGLNFKPGDEYLYTNTNYFLLAEIIRRVTKKPLSTFATENIFQPLGMTHTRFYDNQTDVVPGRVPAYAPGPKGTFQVDWSTNLEPGGPGASDLMTSVDDLLYWDRNFYDDKLGNGTVVKELQTRGLLNSGKQINYALGLFLTKYRGLPVVEHDGSIGGYKTDIIRFPQQRFTVISLCNLASAHPETLTRRVADVYLESQLASAPHSAGNGSAATAPNADPSSYVGTYESTRHSIDYFAVKDGQLTWQGPFSGPVRPVSHGRFTSDDSDLLFEKRGTQMQVVISEVDGTAEVATRVTPSQLSQADLSRYAGTYMSAELGAEYQLSVEQGKLVLHSGWRPALSLSPLTQDEFNGVGTPLTLVFRRGSSGNLVGFEAFTDSARGIFFARQ